MKIILRTLAATAAACVLIGGTASAAAKPEVPGEVFCTIKTESIGPFLSAGAKRELDALVPKLRQAGKGKIVKIEAQSYGISRNEAVYSSYYLGKEVELYLSQIHNLQLDFNVAASPQQNTVEKTQQVRIVLYPDAFDAVKVKPK